MKFSWKCIITLDFVKKRWFISLDFVLFRYFSQKSCIICVVLQYCMAIHAVRKQPYGAYLNNIYRPWLWQLPQHSALYHIFVIWDKKKGCFCCFLCFLDIFAKSRFHFAAMQWRGSWYIHIEKRHLRFVFRLFGT